MPHSEDQLDELQQLWNSGDHGAEQWYEQIEPEVEQMIRQRSGDAISRLKRNAQWEMAFYIPLVIYIVVIWNADFYSFLLLALLFIAAPFSIYFYSLILKAGKEMTGQSVRKALDVQIEIMDRFINRMKWFTWIMLPASFFASAFVSKVEHDEGVDLAFGQPDLTVLLVMLPVLAILMWAALKKYIPALYGKYVDQLREIRNNLVDAQ